MNVSIEIGLLVSAFLIFCSILMSKTGYRFGIPTLLMFLLAGMLFGTDGLGIQFDDVSVAQHIGMVALCIILFTGGMDTKMEDIRPVLSPGVMLATSGVFLTTLFCGLFVYWVSGWQLHTGVGFTLIGSLLLAATMSSTDSASVFNILRSQQINLKHNLKPMLELESGSNDPMAYLLTIILIQCLQAGGVSGWEILWSFLLQFVVGIAVGTFVRMAHQPCEPEECRALFHHGALFHFHHLLLGLFAERQWVSGGLYCRYGHRQQPPVQEEGNRNFS